MHTSFLNIEAKFENNSANITSEAGLIGTIDGDDSRLIWGFASLDQNDVVARHSHTEHRRNASLLSRTTRRFGLKLELSSLRKDSTVIGETKIERDFLPRK